MGDLESFLVLSHKDTVNGAAQRSNRTSSELRRKLVLQTNNQQTSKRIRFKVSCKYATWPQENGKNMWLEGKKSFVCLTYSRKNKGSNKYDFINKIDE